MSLKKLVSGMGLSIAMVVPAHAAQLNVIASGSFHGAMDILIPMYEKLTGNTVHIEWGPSAGKAPESLPMRIKNNEKMDLAIILDDALKSNELSQNFDLSSRTELANSKIGLAVSKGTKVPPLKNEADLKAALLSAQKVAYSQGSSGVYIRSTLFKKLNIEQEMQTKGLEVPGKKLVGEVLAEHQADVGMQQISELKHTKGITFVAPLPESLQYVSKFSSVISKKAEHPQIAAQFVQFLKSKQAASILTNSGLEPLGQ